MKRSLHLLCLAAAAIVVTSSCHAEPARIAPGDLERAIASARPGERLVLAPGHFPALTISRSTFSPPITIDADQAVIEGLLIRNAAGIIFQGGTIETDPSLNFVVLVDNSHDITLTNMRVTGGRIGVTVSRSQGVKLLHNDFDGVRSDGVNVAMSQNVLVEGNRCHNFHPVPAVYDTAGKILQDGDHPDCVQGWSNPRYPPTADVTIVGNQGEGFMQGVFFGNTGQGGYDRLTVRDNNFTLSAFNGIVLMETRDSLVSGNAVHTVPGSKMRNYPFHPITAWIRVTGDRNRVCGNIVDLARVSDPSATQRCS